MTELLDSENLFMEEYKSAQSKISYMAPAFKQQALVHILDGTIAADGEFRDAMMELENPLPEDSKLLLLIGTLQEKVTQITQEKILETVVQLCRRPSGIKYPIFIR